MISKILIKLIDKAIVPAILLLTVRLVSVVLISRQLGIPFTVSNSGFVFSSPEDYVKVNSYSMIAMVLALSIGLITAISKALFFHDSHITPKGMAKVFSLKITSLVQNSFEIYSRWAVWLSYLYLLLLATGIMSLFNLIFAWVLYVTLAACVLASIALIMDIEKEININKLNKSDLDYYEDEEQIVLEFGDDYA